MKRFLTILVVLSVVCASVAAFSTSLAFGGFAGKSEINKGGFAAITFIPKKTEIADFGIKADYIFGITSSTDETIHNEYSVKAVITKVYKDLVLLGGAGIKFNGIKSGTASLDTEIAAKYFFNGSWAVGASANITFKETEFDFATKTFEKTENSDKVIPTVRLFISYTF